MSTGYFAQGQASLEETGGQFHAKAVETCSRRSLVQGTVALSGSSQGYPGREKQAAPSHMETRASFLRGSPRTRVSLDQASATSVFTPQQGTPPRVRPLQTVTRAFQVVGGEVLRDRRDSHPLPPAGQPSLVIFCQASSLPSTQTAKHPLALSALAVFDWWLLPLAGSPSRKGPTS